MALFFPCTNDSISFSALAISVNLVLKLFFARKFSAQVNRESGICSCQLKFRLKLLLS